uniref:Secreted protein n=1 Tax=Anguilla anguilla TaxID=7936 RepID=A0A0E9SX74_ANGAN
MVWCGIICYCVICIPRGWHGVAVSSTVASQLEDTETDPGQGPFCFSKYSSFFSLSKDMQVKGILFRIFNIEIFIKITML